MKASEKQTVCKKLVTALKKRYKSTVPKTDRSVLDLMLFAVCQENVSVAASEAAFERLMTGFHGYNDLRVSSLTELETAFDGAEQSEYRAMRVRSVLHDVFERRGLKMAENETYKFDFEILRRMTLDAATKLLGKLRNLSGFIKVYALHSALGAHLVPVDDRMRDAAVWLGLVTHGSTTAQASDQLKPAVRKADVARFSSLLRALATDPRLVRTFASAASKAPESGFDAFTALERLDELFRTAAKKRKSVKRKPARSAARKKTKSSKKPTAKRTPKSAARKKTKAKTAKSATGKKTKTKTGKSAARKKTKTKRTAAKTTSRKKTKTKRTATRR